MQSRLKLVPFCSDHTFFGALGKGGSCLCVNTRCLHTGFFQDYLIYVKAGSNWLRHNNRTFFGSIQI